ncbi:MAG: CpaF family protein [Candidatus Diapherotrites archaeon]|uniref:CpaF family protein n=1 Tax=Candidatus Iainarchaeum sp. TaxID=3101447 RepID=A0A7J4IRQ1_9ARCH|nr:MAG: archaeal flagellar protein FlaI [archaeon GW2011_AR10]MBS3059318.1 CpaF family protein [Candidatus Diapherotrites archaeon]HIH08191.1 CpaF family protein [Candidatus Diapherotrites archaeon]
MASSLKEIKGVKVDSYGETEIFEGFPVFFYSVVQAPLSEQEKNIASLLRSLIVGKISLDAAQQSSALKIGSDFLAEFQDRIISTVNYKEGLSKIMSPEDYDALRVDLIALLKQFFPNLKNTPELVNQVLDATVGYGRISSLMRDSELEEIMINGFDRPVFVFHKTFGMCKANLVFQKGPELELLINKIASTVGKTFDDSGPLLDARLLGGNRANATYPLVTPFGPSLTIRKFTRTPLSIIDLIANSTLSSELAAFLWVMVEGLNIEPMNIIITGGTGSGKTTTLNVLSSFIRHQDRIVTIEDTLELDLGSRENWVQLESKPHSRESPEVTMDDLLKNALRMRPDRILVGEVRGSEARTLFVAMDTGHQGSMGTLHSNSSSEMILRLKAEPMGVPEAMIPLLDLIVVQYRMYIKGKGILRRIAQVSEVASMEKQALLSNVFEWNRSVDKIVKTDIPSHIMEKLADKTMRTKKEISREIDVRKKVFDWMLANNIHSTPDVETVIQRYYYDAETILERVAADL